MSKTATDQSARDAPNSEKSRTIVDVAYELGDDATNAAIADEVEDRIDDRPDPSWVSRVRSKYVDDSAPETTRTPPPAGSSTTDDRDDLDRLLIRLDTVAGRLDRFASDVEDLHDRIDDVEARVEAAADGDAGIDPDDVADRFDDLADAIRP